MDDLTWDLDRRSATLPGPPQYLQPPYPFEAFVGFGGGRHDATADALLCLLQIPDGGVGVLLFKPMATEIWGTTGLSCLLHAT